MTFWDFCLNALSKFFPTMSYMDFWLSVLSNFVATIVAGYLIFKFIENRFNDKEKRTEEIEIQIEQEEKTIKYLFFLRDEVTAILKMVDKYLVEFKASEIGIYHHLDTSYWEIIKSSGELPLRISPYTLKTLTNFYSTAIEINTIDQRLENAQLTQGRGIGRFIFLLQTRLRFIKEMETKYAILDVINNRLNTSQEKIVKLEAIKAKW